MMKKSLLITAIAGATATPVVAQTATPAGTELEEVVVTAQRREENLQDLSVSASALDADTMKTAGVAKIIDLQSATPSLSVTDTGLTLNVNIRGIGIASDSPNVTAGVATYMDGLFQPPIVQSNNFYDLQSVEVLRGPQGTFVGSNSTGGAIFINSRDPELDSLDGYAEISGGNYDNRGAEGAINVPLADNLALRLAGFKRERDSFYRDVGPFDNDAGKLDEYGARLGVLWAPGNFEALLKMQSNDRKTGGYAYQPVEGTQLSGFRVGDNRTLSFDEDTSYNDKAHSTSLELRYELENGVVLRSLSGFQNKTVTNFSDNDASQAPLAAGGLVAEDYHANEKQYSQEINIISPTDGVFDWVVGAYYQANDINVKIMENQAGFPTDIVPQNERKTTGYFAQGNYALREDLELQIGARHSTYDAEGSGDVTIGRGIPGFPPDGIVVADLSGDYDDSRVTGKVALNWTVNVNHLLFALASKGYKPGGFNSQTSTFDPEEVMSYEIGWKANFHDDLIRTQVNLFYNDYSDFQFSVLEPSTGIGGVDNLADLTIKGIEAQVQARFGGFLINGNIGYSDSSLPGLTFVNQRMIPEGTSLPQCPQGVPPNPQLCFDYNPFIVSSGGGDALYAPELTYSLGVQYDFVLDSGIRLTPGINYAFIDEQYAYFAYSPVTDLLESRELLSASLVLTNEVWRVEMYGTNLTDDDYVSGQSGNREFYGAPREYGVRLGFNW